MPSWLAEDPIVLYMVLATAAVLLGAGYWMKRKRGYLFGLGAMVVLVGLVWLLDFLIVTERERLLHTVQAMARRVEALDIDGVFAHISNEFISGNNLKKEEFRQAVKNGVRVYQVREMQMWDLEVVELSMPDKSAKVEFHAKVRGNWSGGEEFYLVRADFVLDSDGQWRMKGFTLHRPFANQNEPLPLPPLPR